MHLRIFKAHLLVILAALTTLTTAGPPTTGNPPSRVYSSKIIQDEEKRSGLATHARVQVIAQNAQDTGTVPIDPSQKYLIPVCGHLDCGHWPTGTLWKRHGYLQSRNATELCDEYVGPYDMIGFESVGSQGFAKEFVEQYVEQPGKQNRWLLRVSRANRTGRGVGRVGEENQFQFVFRESFFDRGDAPYLPDPLVSQIESKTVFTVQRIVSLQMLQRIRDEFAINSRRDERNHENFWLLFCTWPGAHELELHDLLRNLHVNGTLNAYATDSRIGYLWTRYLGQFNGEEAHENSNEGGNSWKWSILTRDEAKWLNHLMKIMKPQYEAVIDAALPYFRWSLDILLRSTDRRLLDGIEETGLEAISVYHRQAIRHYNLAIIELQRAINNTETSFMPEDPKNYVDANVRIRNIALSARKWGAKGVKPLF